MIKADVGLKSFSFHDKLPRSPARDPSEDLCYRSSSKLGQERPVCLPGHSLRLCHVAVNLLLLSSPLVLLIGGVRPHWTI
jgi:hypothetical protein